MPVLMSLYYSHHASFMRSFSYIPHTDHSEDVFKHIACWFGENLLVQVHTSCWSYLGHVFLLYCNCNDYTEIIPDVICFIEEFLWHSLSWFYWGISLTLFELGLVRSFSYTPLSVFFFFFPWGVSLTLLEMVLVRSFSYTLHTSFSEEFPLHSWY